MRSEFLATHPSNDDHTHDTKPQTLAGGIVGDSASREAIIVSLAIIRFRRGLAAFASSPIADFGRRVLPMAIKQPLANLVRWAGSVTFESQYAGPLISLSELEPLCTAEAFSANKVILVNSALAWGGAERQVVTLLHALQKRGRPSGLLCLRLGDTVHHDFYLPMLNSYEGFVRNAFTLKEAKVVLAELSPRQRDQISAVLKRMPPYVGDEIFRFVAEFLTLKPRAVHAWQDSVSIAAGYAARIVGVPRIVVSSRNVNPTNFAYFQPYMYDAYRGLAECANIQMVNNSEAGALDYASWLKIDRNRFEVHRNGIDMSAFQQATPERVAVLRNSLKIPNSAPVVGSVFRFYPEKDPRLWVDMAKLVAAERPDVHFVIFGVGPMKNTIEAIVRKYGLSERVHLPGAIAESNLAFGLFDAFVLTSRHEGTPNVIIEASALGVPVVTTEAGGAAEAIKSGETGLVAERDAGKLAKSVLSILADPTWSTRASERGPAFINERFGLDRMVDEALAYYGLFGTGTQPDVFGRAPQ